MRVRRRGPGQHHRHSSRHAEHESRDLEPGERSIPSSTESASTSSGTMVSMIEPSIGEVIDKPYMMKTLRNTRSAAQRRSVCEYPPARPSRPSATAAARAKRGRGDERRRDHRHRMHVMRQDYVVKRVIHRPEDVAHQQGQMGFQSVHSFRRLPRKDKNSARIPTRHGAKKGLPAKKAPYITQIARYRRSGIRNVAGEAPGITSPQ